VRAYATNSVGTGYGDVLSFNSLYYSVSDIDGNSYRIVTIGTQTWMAENLRSTKFTNGTSIQLMEDASVWGSWSSGTGYCWYNNDMAKYKDTYGALYNCNAVRDWVYRLCPTGWHVPSVDEWSILESYLGGWSVAGDKLKEIGTTHWRTGNAGTNSSGFTALPGGTRGDNGSFGQLGSTGYWWTTSLFSGGLVGYRSMSYNKSSVDWATANRLNGFSVRCLKDN
jgi:uncharacterized protein (TIGR02145 family)